MNILIGGGGFAGLLASIRLDRAGQNVTLVERSAEPSGRGRSSMTAGMRANLGPHAIYQSGHVFNGESALVMEFAEALNDNAKRLAYHIEVNAVGLIRRANVFANPHTLGSILWPGPESE